MPLSATPRRGRPSTSARKWRGAASTARPTNGSTSSSPRTSVSRGLPHCGAVSAARTSLGAPPPSSFGWCATRGRRTGPRASRWSASTRARSERPGRPSAWSSWGPSATASRS
eukprot:11299099-Alexandrium_andersonii.AAC.1